VDKRTDIWSFGCLLYELLTGRQPFAGDTPSDSLAAVLAREPDMTLVPAATPDAIRSLLRHCLEKEPRRRLRDIADARLAIDDVLKQLADGPSRPTQPAGGWPRARIGVGAIAVLAVVGLAAAMAGLGMRWPAKTPPATGTGRVVTSIVLPRGMYLSGTDLEARAAESRLAVSPDGRRLALIAADESGRTQLWLRDLASSVFRPLPETEEASFPFWSPDSASIGFVARGKLKVIAVAGGTPRTVSDSGFRTGAWSRSNRILFSPGPSSPLHVVPASGGQSAAATRLDTASGEAQHGYPAFLPDGRHFLYFSMGSMSGGALDPRGVYLGSLDGDGRPRLLLAGATQARYANGHMLFVQNGTLTAQPFDTDRMALHGAPFPLVEDVKLFTAGATGATAAFSVSDNGVLVYQSALRTESRMVVLDRAGTEVGRVTAPADYADVSLSPDGDHVAVSMRDPNGSTRDLWMYDMRGGRGQRLTFGPNDEFAPVWSPDGRRLLFSSMTRSGVDLHVKDVNSAAEPARLDVDSLGLGRFAADWSRDGRHIMYIGGGRAISRSDLWVAQVARPGSARPLLESAFVETHGRFAPGGRWFAYTSNETGRLEVYADRFPERGAKRLVSSGGGGWPRWAARGSEILYLSSDNRLMSAAVRASADRLHVAAPRPLFALRPRPPARLDAYGYDVSPDGRRFVVNTLIEDTTPTAITLVLNWTAALADR
jgi:Tol biopolymer transport system component